MSGGVLGAGSGVVMAALFLGERLGAAALLGTAITLMATILIMKYDPGAA